MVAHLWNAERPLIQSFELGFYQRLSFADHTQLFLLAENRSRTTHLRWETLIVGISWRMGLLRMSRTMASYYWFTAGVKLRIHSEYSPDLSFFIRSDEMWLIARLIGRLFLPIYLALCSSDIVWACVGFLEPAELVRLLFLCGIEWLSSKRIELVNRCIF